MANYATEAEFETRYPEQTDQASGVIDEYLTEAHVFIVAEVGDLLATVVADTDGAEAMKQAEMMLAFESIMNRPIVGVGGGKQQTKAQSEGDRARRLIEVWTEWAGGRSGSLHTEKLTDEPTFDMDDPETWGIDTYDSDS